MPSRVDVERSVFSVAAVALLLAAQLLPVALEAVEAILERVALAALHPGVEDETAVLKLYMGRITEQF